MIKIFRFAICIVVALLMVGCEAAFDSEPTIPDVKPGKPTVPLKKRPIVPTTKLPRPRVAEEYATAEAEVYEATEWEYCEEW